MSLSKIKIGYSPLGDRLMLYRHGKDPSLALERRECEAELMAALTEKMMLDAPKGATQDFRLGDQWYRMTLKPIDSPQEAPTCKSDMEPPIETDEEP